MKKGNNIIEELTSKLPTYINYDRGGKEDIGGFGYNYKGSNDNSSYVGYCMYLNITKEFDYWTAGYGFLKQSKGKTIEEALENLLEATKELIPEYFK